MGKCAILRHFATDAGGLSGGNWQPTLPLAHLLDDDLGAVARSLTASPADTQFRVDFGTTVTRYLSHLVLLAHTISNAGMIRFVLATDAAGAVRVYDSGYYPAWRAVVVDGAEPWSSFTADGLDIASGVLTSPSVIHLLPTMQPVGPGGARYLFVFINDPANPAGYVDIGRFIGGPAWSPTINMQFGFEVTPIDPSVARRTIGGKRIVERRRGWNEFRLRFGRLTKAEAFGFLYGWQKQGIAQPVWFMAEGDTADEAGARRSAWCALKGTASFTHDLPFNETIEFLLEELV